MPLLTFGRRWEEALLSGTKTMTLRANSPWWLRQSGRGEEEAGLLLEAAGDRVVWLPNESGNPLHIWLGNPRLRCGRAWVRKLGTSREDWELGLVRGTGIDDDLARRDGLEDARDLREGLARLNGMTPGQVGGHVWAVVRWRWPSGRPVHLPCPVRWPSDPYRAPAADGGGRVPW